MTRKNILCEQQATCTFTSSIIIPLLAISALAYLDAHLRSLSEIETVHYLFIHNLLSLENWIFHN